MSLYEDRRFGRAASAISQDALRSILVAHRTHARRRPVGPLRL